MNMKQKYVLLAAFGLLTAGAGSSLVSGQNNVIKIGGYDGPTDTALVQDLINKFVKPDLAKDGIDVQYVPTADYGKQIVNQLSAGTAPDLFYLEAPTATALANTGKVLPLDGLVNSADFLPGLNKTFTVKGKLYGIAKDFNTLTMYFNKDLFDQAGVAYPNKDDTWNDFESKITKVKAALGAGYQGTCFPAEYSRFGAFAASTGWKNFDSKGRTILDAKFQRAFNWYASLVKKGVAVQPSQVNAGWGGDCMKSGKVATAFEGAWALGFLRDQAPNLKYGTSLLPKDPVSKRSGNLLYTVAWAINADSKNRDAAVKVLNALTSKAAQEFVLRGGLALPSRKALQTDPYFKQQTVEAQANANVFKGASVGYVLPFAAAGYGDAWFKPIDEALKAVLDGKDDSATALKRAQAALDKLTSN
jgi:multiple sugar transport system substrate-binding protein